ncbi:DUF1904 domain-containing protein [Paenibacillus sp. HWE-109]|uniref:DUF1904 family protein n=1 Tax=Paenibacillus sp. HWE-109 TaxID=1306526 RepID=UPI001EE022CB|nr:DUF1904 family protein [Paenibacillus sp. HWE-109]UKS24425.1 DUF1904 domain-containing protein [Paenibacillus sp. HWE-109]
MPRLIIRGLTVEQVCQISVSLVDQLALICACSREDFTLECVQHPAIFDGQIVPTYPFIEVAWFERGEQVREQVAVALTSHVHGLGIPEVEVAFITYSQDAYFNNGISFK